MGIATPLGFWILPSLDSHCLTGLDSQTCFELENLQTWQDWQSWTLEIQHLTLERRLPQIWGNQFWTWGFHFLILVTLQENLQTWQKQIWDKTQDKTLLYHERNAFNLLLLLLDSDPLESPVFPSSLLLPILTLVDTLALLKY